MEYDLVLRGGWVIDGTGAAPFLADVAIQKTTISEIGKLATAQARLELEIEGQYVAPGFIDAHVHGDLELIADPLHLAAIKQGVTTYILGQDGTAFAPGRADTLEYMKRYSAGFNGPHRDLAITWSSFEEYLTRLDRNCSLNVAVLIPNGNIRLDAIGHDPRPATDSELAVMRRAVGEAMEAGAIGLSTGLDYIPSRYADEREIATLCEAVAPFGGVYVTHMRGYGRHAATGMEEVFKIAQKSGIAAHISHYNGPADLLLPLIDQGRASGIDLTYDTYPYLAGSTILAMVALPAWVQIGGIEATIDRLKKREIRDRLDREWFCRPLFNPLDAMTIGLAADPSYAWAEGMLVTEAARRANQPICDFVCDILLSCDLAVGVVSFRPGERTEADVREIFRHPAHMAGSDGIFCGSAPHPRGWGAFARYLGHHTRERRDYQWAEAITHLSTHAARRYRLTDRGLLRPGFAADLVIFDSATVIDRATYADSKRYAEGVRHVLVNGEFVLRDGVHTGKTPGRALRRG